MVNIWEIAMFIHNPILPAAMEKRGTKRQIFNYGKINPDMEQPKITLVGSPPRMFRTFLNGFNTVANRVYLIILPVIIDLALWLGPKLRLKTLLMPRIEDLTSQMLKVAPPDLVETVKTTQTMWATLLDRFNLATTIRTLPVGVSSLMARISPMNSPLSWNPVIEISTINWAVAALGIFLTAGFLLGSLYFYLVSLATNPENSKFDFKEYLQDYVNSVILFCLILGVAILVSIPLLILLSLLSLFSAGVAQFFILLVGFGLIWLLIPMIFSVHGIFVLKKKPTQAVIFSIRLVRFFLPGTGLFIMTAVLASELLNKLWTMPDPNSWLLLLGVGGHAFVVTGFLAASFIYFREGVRWMQDNMALLSNQRNVVQSNGGTSSGQ
jgi:hypothetical protein